MLERPPDIKEVAKGHGRAEIRELWFEDSWELGVYLEEALGWPGLRYCGLVRRRRCRLSRLERAEGWEEQEVWWASGGKIEDLSSKKALEGLRGHWEIENRLYWVRDVSFSEDRLSGRKVGPGLSMIRNIALNLIRSLGYRFVVDGFRAISARSDRGLSLLIQQSP